MIKRIIPPAAAPVEWKAFIYAIKGFFSEDKAIARLEEEIKEFFGVRYTFLLSSGKSALYLILKSLKRLSGERSNVIIPAYTCFSVPSAIKKAGLNVILCDIEKNFDFNYNHLNRLLDDNTLCVIGTHLFGIPIDIERLIEICHRKKIYVIEDAAQAMGVFHKGKWLGTFGDIGFFSLGRGKNLCAGGGGIIITNSEMIASEINREYQLADRMDFYSKVMIFFKILMINIFIHPLLYWIPRSIKSLKIGETVYYKDFPVNRLSGVQAGFLHDWQRRLKRFNYRRTRNAELIIKETGIDLPMNIPYIRLPLILKNKDLKEFLHNISIVEGLGIEKMYPHPINEIEDLREDFKGKDYPSSKSISESLLTLPTHHLLSERDRRRISGLIKRCIESS